MDLVALRARLLPTAVCAIFGLVAWRATTSAVTGSRVIVLAIAGALVALGALLRPRAALLLLLVLGATVLPTRGGAFTFGGIRSDVTEALAFLLVGVWVVHLLRRDADRPRFLVPWMVFYAAVAIGLWVGALHGGTRSDLIGYGKAYAFYLLPPVFCTFFARASDQDVLERWLIRLCTAGSIVTLAAAALGVNLGSDALTSTVETLGTSASAQRIRTPLLALLVVGILVLSGRVMTANRTRPADAVRLALATVAVLLSFNRSTWAPLVLAVVFLAVARRGRRVAGRGLRVSLVLLVVVAVTYAGARSGSLGPTAQAAAVRAASALNTSVTGEKSYQDRQEETRDATAALRRSPLLGVGAGRPYGARRPVYFDDPPRIVFVDRLFIHNTYLGIWLATGLLGLVGVVLLGIAVLREAYLARRDLPPDLATRHLAAALALATFALSALFQTSLTHRPTILGIAVAMALLHQPVRDDATVTSDRRAARPA